MRTTSVLLLLFGSLPSVAAGQATPGAQPGMSRVETLVGVGNSFSGIGVLADIKPFARGPLSVMLSVGSTDTYFNLYSGSVSRVAAAMGVRANAGHGRHQGFLELALLPVDDDVVEFAPARERTELLYGLGLQLGYRVRVTRGITLNAMGGAGYALNEGVVASRWKPLIGFGFGYAWPRR